MNNVSNIVKKLIPERYHKSLIDLKDLILYKGEKVSRKNRRVIETLLRDNKPIKLELSAGTPRGMNGWTTIDWNHKCDIRLDLSRPLPFPDNCVSMIYSSHLLEHFSYPSPMTELLAECHRILKPRGIFSIAVPNARIYLNAYFEPEKFDYRGNCKPTFRYRSKIDYVNYIAYMEGHHSYMFDEENLLVILADAGFKNVRIRDFDPDLDVESQRHLTIYAEGEK